MINCPICGGYIFTSGLPHKCPPAWEVYLEGEDEDDFEIIYEHFDEDAACKYVEKHYCDFDYPDNVVVFVRRHIKGEVQHVEQSFYVTAEQKTVFSATKRKLKPEE